MDVFSKRNKYVEYKLDLKYVSKELKNKIVNITIMIIKNHLEHLYIRLKTKVTKIEQIMNECNIPYIMPNNDFDNQMNICDLQNYFEKEVEWYKIYDFMEKSIFVLRNENDLCNALINHYNRILEEEGALYRIIDDKVVPIINEIEIKSISEVLDSTYGVVNNHIAKALELLSNKKNPDYENSIKESISAVESLCSIITDTNGKDNTLGKTLDLLVQNGCSIHGSLREAFKKIYGYTSDEGGIRHGADIEKNAKIEDAIYMVVSCSAFINYLISKNESKS